MNIDQKTKKLIEDHPITIATAMSDGNPNVIAVAFVKVVGENKVLITDNFMNQTLKDIENNNNVVLMVWDKEMNGCKLIGEAEYFTSGDYIDQIKAISENNDMPCKGALVVTISKYFATA